MWSFQGFGSILCLTSACERDLSVSGRKRTTDSGFKSGKRATPGIPREQSALK